MAQMVACPTLSPSGGANPGSNPSSKGRNIFHREDDVKPSVLYAPPGCLHDATQATLINKFSLACLKVRSPNTIPWCRVNSVNTPRRG